MWNSIDFYCGRYAGTSKLIAFLLFLCSFFVFFRIVPNCIMKAKSERRRPFIGDQIEECRDASGLFYILCFQRGYLVNWDVQVFYQIFQCL